MADTPGSYSFSNFINTFAAGVESAVRTTAAVISRDNPLNRPTKHNADPYSTGSVNQLDMSNTSRGLRQQEQEQQQQQQQEQEQKQT